MDNSINQYSPRLILLKDDNYLNWSVLMERKIEKFGWRDLLKTPWKKAGDIGEDDTASDEGSTEAARTPEEEQEASRRNDCSTFILENIDTKYWWLIDARERDPYVMWREIKQVWVGNWSDLRFKKFELPLMSLELGQQSMFNYLARARWLYECSIQTGAGSLSSQTFVEQVLEGLPDEGYLDVKQEIRADLAMGEDLPHDKLVSILLTQEARLREK
ncbi:hypothetical protein ABW20_dc0103121 [Dactylellina cionopaga]|nr:hypothetical protein ABW20_dc0103121 [Dactylellina cionopaga]